MLQGILIALSLAVSYFLVYLAYGKQGMQTRKEMGIKFTTVLQVICVLLVTVLYALLVGLWNMESSHELWEYAVLVGVPVAYGLFVLYARYWSKRMVKLWKEEKEREHQEELEKKEQARKEQQQKIIEVTKKEERIAALKKSAAGNSSLEEFLLQAEAAQRFSEVLTYWDATNPADTEFNAMIRQEIEKKRTAERMYGSTPEKIKLFLKTLQEKYGDVIVETSNVEETVPSVTVAPAKKNQFDDFLQKAGKCQKGSEILQVWDSYDWSDLPAAEAIRKKIVGKMSVERMYGALPEQIPAFLLQLQELFENANQDGSL